jgi:hypothetical protein
LEEAGAAAIRLVQGEDKFLRLAQTYGEPPELTVDEAEPTAGDENATNRTGYVFYDNE